MNLKLAKLLLVIVAKAPEPGKVKTRLMPDLSSQEAADLYRSFLQDKIEIMGMLKNIDLAISYTPFDAKDTFTALTGNKFKLFCQRGKDLGQRLNNIFIDKFRGNYDAVSIIDSDSPDLPGSIVMDSFKRLSSSQTDVVFGPCHDGGYYLVGMKRPHPELFDDIPWSTERVLSETLKKAERLNLKTELLPGWNDLDTFSDLVSFYNKYKSQAPKIDAVGGNALSYLSRLNKINP